MRYLALYRTAERNAPPTGQEMAAMGQLMAEMSAAGVLLAAEGCQPSRHGARVRRSGGQVTVKDGPFTETKEIIGGFAIFQVDSKEDAIHWTKRFLEVAGDGESEVRLLHDAPAHSEE